MLARSVRTRQSTRAAQWFPNGAHGMGAAIVHVFQQLFGPGLRIGEKSAMPLRMIVRIAVRRNILCRFGKPFASMARAKHLAGSEVVVVARLQQEYRRLPRRDGYAEPPAQFRLPHDSAAGDIDTMHFTPRPSRASRCAVSNAWMPPNEPPATTIRFLSTKGCCAIHE